jgi:membrane peptidoglycan carboxypeptidase
VSNPDWPGPYWQDQQEAGPGWRNRQVGAPEEQSPWDDGSAGFWRSSGGSSNGHANGHSDGPASPRSNGHANGNDRVRRAAAGRGAGPRDDFWEDSPRRSRRARGAGADPGWDDGATQAWRDPETGRGGYRGSRRAGSRTFDQTSARAAVTDRYSRAAAGMTGMRTRVTERMGRGGGAGGGRGGPGGRDGRGGYYDGPPLSGGQRLKRWLLYGNWWRRWTVKKVLAVFGCACAAFILLCIGVFFLLYSMTPIPTATSEFANWQSSTVYLANGQPLGTFENGGQSRELLTTAQIPTVMTQAMTAAEDRNFYHEGGISVTGLMRSAYDDIFGGGNLQGGSTLTMQFAKNYYPDVNTGQNISTKLKEIFIAMKLGREESKSWVMTNYLNTVPFGPTEYGLGAATQAYFGLDMTKPADEKKLTVPMAAMLAAMPNAPGLFNPDPKAGADYDALVARYQYVLTNMVRDGNITAQQASAYDHEFPKITPAPALSQFTGQKGYLWQMVQQELEAPAADGGYGLTAQQLARGGYKIYTTFSLGKTNALVHSVNTERAQVAALQGAPMPQYDWIGGVLENAKTGAIVAVDGGPGYGVKNCEKTAVSCEWNRAEAPEEVGSSFKPYVLATAVNEGMNVFTSKLNGFAPIAIPYAPETTAVQDRLSLLNAPPGEGQLFNTNNNQSDFTYNGVQYQVFDEAGENYNRAQPVNIAAAVSSDPAFEDLTHRDGVSNVVKMAESLGIGQNPFNANCPTGASAATMTTCGDLKGLEKLGREDNLEITFGASPLTAVEQASTFATLADDGTYHSPHVIAKVMQGTRQLPSDIIIRRVLSPAAAADTDWALSFDNNNPVGTADATVSFRRGGIIAKTGTLGVNQNSSEAWFVGATPRQYSLAIALYTQAGNGTTQVLNTLPSANGTAGEDGGAWPATIWNDFMTNEFGNQSWQPVDQVFHTVNGYPFVPWIQVKVAAKKQVCRPGQTQNCIPACQQHGHGHGQGNCGNPGPTSSCGPFPGMTPCGGPSPTPSCGGFGQQPCGPSPTPSTPSPTTSPSPTASPSPSCFPPGSCHTTPGVTGGQVQSVSASLLAVIRPAGEEAATAVGVRMVT